MSIIPSLSLTISSMRSDLNACNVTAKHRVFTYLNTCPWLTYGPKKRLEQRLENVLILARIFRNNEDPHESSPASS